MCGISGVFGSNFGVKKISAMSSLIKHRGPDQYGEFLSLDGKLALAHQRLSILDLSKFGQQPMKSENGKYVIVFNGEIYNFKDLRASLLNEKAINFKGHSDTEILLECINAWGVEKTLPLLNGMFAFAVYDVQKNIIVLARDRFGEKPLYIFSNSKGFTFSSELKPIEYLNKELTLNQNALDAQLRYSYIPSPYTIYNEVFKLPAGHSITIDLNKYERFTHHDALPYWEIVGVIQKALNARQNFNHIEDSINAVEKVLTKSVKERMVADVPLGAFLSGGIDSTCITAIMQANSEKPINTFSIGFNDENYNEAHHAKKVAKILGTEHNELYLDPNEMLDYIPQISNIYDEPFSDSSQLPTLMVSNFAKKRVTVALTGDSGDELFCGYNRYSYGVDLFKRFNGVPLLIRKGISSTMTMPSPQAYNYIVNVLAKLSSRIKKYKSVGDKVYKLAAIITFKDDADLYQKLITTWPHSAVTGEIHDIATDVSTAFNFTGITLAEKMMWQDTIDYMQNDILTKVDRASMSASLETRVPFLDNEVFELSWSIPIEHKIYNKESKYPLRKIISKYIPDELMNRPKAGFGVPIDNWLRKELKPWADSLLNETTLGASGLLNVNEVTKIWKLHLSGKSNMRIPLWNVLMFQQWYLTKNK